MSDSKRPRLLDWVRLPSPGPLFEPFQATPRGKDDVRAKTIKGRVVRRKMDPPPAARSAQGMMARLPVVGRRFKPVDPPPKKAGGPLSRTLALPRRLIAAIAPPPPPPPPPASSIPFVSPVVRRVRQPLLTTARMVQVAREARKPKSRWSRVRDAARVLVEGEGSHLERVAGFGVALAGPGRRAIQVAPATLRARLGAWMTPKPPQKTKGRHARRKHKGHEG